MMQVLQHFQQYKVNPTPINYVVWYEYVLARNVEVQKAINESLKAKGGFTDVVGYRIYQLHIKAMPEGIVHVNDEINDVSKSLVQSLQDISKHVDSHIELLEGNHTLEQLAALKTTVHETKRRAIHSIVKAGKISEQVAHVCNHITRDPITKLFSRIKLDHDYKLYRDSGANPGLLLIDIDGFSEINKEHGMLVAENILRHVANVIKEVASAKHAYRLGGHDEFCIMTGALMKDAALTDMANTILKKIEDIRLVDKNTQKVIAENMTATAMLFEGTNNGLQVAYENAKKEMRLTKRNKRMRRQKQKADDLAA